jgi:hypothetical protein
MNLKLSRDSLDVAMTETSRELAELKQSFQSLQQDYARVWQLVDSINQVRPLPRSSASLPSILAATPLAAAGTFVTTNISPTNAAVLAAYAATTNHSKHDVVLMSPPHIITHDRDSSTPSPMLSTKISAGPISPTAARYNMTSPSAAMVAATMNVSSSSVPSSLPPPPPPSSPPPTTNLTINEPEPSQVMNMVSPVVPPISTTLKQLVAHPVCLELLKDALQTERSIENMMYGLSCCHMLVCLPSFSCMPHHLCLILFGLLIGSIWMLVVLRPSHPQMSVVVKRYQYLSPLSVRMHLIKSICQQRCACKYHGR